MGRCESLPACLGSHIGQDGIGPRYSAPDEAPVALFKYLFRTDSTPMRLPQDKHRERKTDLKASASVAGVFLVRAARRSIDPKASDGGIPQAHRQADLNREDVEPASDVNGTGATEKWTTWC